MRDHFDVSEVSYRWSTQDNYTVDGLPFVGEVPGAAGIRTATGFGGWGMSNGTLSAMLVADAVKGVTSPWSDVYALERRSLGPLRQALPDREHEDREAPARRPARVQGGETVAMGEAQPLTRRPEGSGFPRCERRADRGVGVVHSHGLHRRLECRRVDLGLSVPRLAIRARRESPKPGNRAARADRARCNDNGALTCSGRPRVAPHRSWGCRARVPVGAGRRLGASCRYPCVAASPPRWTRRQRARGLDRISRRGKSRLRLDRSRAPRRSRPHRHVDGRDLAARQGGTDCTDGTAGGNVVPLPVVLAHGALGATTLL